MKKMIIALALVGGVTAIAYASLSNHKDKSQTAAEKKAEKKKECRKTCLFS